MAALNTFLFSPMTIIMFQNEKGEGDLVFFIACVLLAAPFVLMFLKARSLLPFGSETVKG